MATAVSAQPGIASDKPPVVLTRRTVWLIFVLTLFLREVTLSDVAGMVARGEAIADHGRLVEGVVAAAAEPADRSQEATSQAADGQDAGTLTR